MTNKPFNDPAGPILYAGSLYSTRGDTDCAGRMPAAEEGEIENDCACADAVLPAAVEPSAALYQRSPGLYSAPLAGPYRLALGLASPVGPVVMNNVAWQVLETFDQPRQLSKDPAAHIEQDLARYGLLAPLDGALDHAPVRQTLTAWLHVTNACNLACPYCYVQKSGETMRLETGRRALAGLFAAAGRRGFSQVKIKYAGGEASLHFKLVRLLHAEATRLSQETGIGLQAVLLSNGTRIHPEDADWLREHNVRLMISLDGAAPDHDRLRSTRGGQGTFSIIERTIDEVLLTRGVRPSISITVSGMNAGGIAGAVRWALVRDLPFSINFYRVPPSASAPQALALEEERIIAGMKAAYQVVEELLPARPLLNGLLDRFRVGAHQATCGVGHAYVVIDHKGRVAPCHMCLPAAGEARPGHQDGKAVTLDPLSQMGVSNLPVDSKEGCRTCSFRYYCTGGCPLEAFRSTGRWDAASPNCRIYKTLIPLALRLEGLRLLKQNGVQ